MFPRGEFACSRDSFPHLVVRVLSHDQARRRRVGFDDADDGVRRLVRIAWFLPFMVSTKRRNLPLDRS